MQNKSHFSARTATMLVIANMVGTGVFTSLGYQLLDINSPGIILVLWLLGGVIALCGALCYAELGAALPRSGGEYNFLGRIYHPGAGFVSGWISVFVGFSAPTAAAAITAATYMHSVVPWLPTTLTALLLVTVIGLVHLGSRAGSSLFQQLFTGLKIVLILIFMGLALWQVEALQEISFIPHVEDWSLMTTGGFAVALIYVNYAYTGWNAATYLAGEVQDPQRTIPQILIFGTIFVMVLYLALHMVFLSVAPMSAMAGKIEVGFVVADYAFGRVGANLIGLMLGFLLISTISAMLLAGPRALQVMGQDFPVFARLAKENAHGIPANAIKLQMGLTLLMIVSASFEQIIVFSGAVLALNSLLTVFGVAVLRWREPDLERPFITPLYPLPLLVFVGLIAWTLTFLVLERPLEGLLAAALILLGALVYWWTGGSGRD